MNLPDDLQENEIELHTTRFQSGCRDFCLAQRDDGGKPRALNPLELLVLDRAADLIDREPFRPKAMNLALCRLLAPSVRTKRVGRYSQEFQGAFEVYCVSGSPADCQETGVIRPDRSLSGFDGRQGDKVLRYETIVEKERLMGRKKANQSSKAKSRRAALYCRVSTFDQNRGDYSSLEDQKTRLRRAAEAEGYEVYRVFKEVASSASLERDELRRLLGKLDEIDAVFVTKLDRLSRSMHDWCRLNELFDKYNVALVSTTQKIDTTTPRGRFFRDLLMLFAQFEREMIAERTYEKMAEQARQGRWGGGHPILGYDVVNKRLVVNATEAAVVLAIYRKYLEIGSLSRTARWANLQGYRTKGLKYSNGREIAPRKFTRADVQRLLTNVLYIGKVRFDDVNYQAEHEAIVPEDLFWEVQSLLAAKKEKPRRGDQTQQDTLLLGLLRCGYCGSAYTSSFVNKKGKDGKPKRYYYYKCTRKTKHEAAACPAADLRADIIDEAFVKFFRELSQEPDKLAGVIIAAEDSSKEGCGAIEKERNRLSAELAKAERQAMALVGRLEDPEFSQIDAVKFRLAELNAQQQVLKAQITDLTLQLRDRRDQSLSLEEVREAYQQFEELWDELSFPERQYAVRLLVRQVELLFRRGERDGQIKIEAWGRSPTPISLRLHDFRESKLRNQDVRLPG